MSGKDKSGGGVKVITRNRKARHNYFVTETFEGGLVLVGSEVKSLRAHKVTMTDAYARFEGNELWLVKVHINPYPQANQQNHEPERPRKVLMHKRELRRLKAKVQEAGLTLIPLSLYFKESHVKVEIGLCKGKKMFDKRETLRKKDHARDIERARKDHRK